MGTSTTPVPGVRIGLCYNLRRDFLRQPDDPVDANADWDVPETVDLLLRGLATAGFQVVDIGDPRALAKQSVAKSVDLVFSICEMRGFRYREALVPALCELLGIPYALSSPDALVVSLDKNLCNYVVSQAGGAVPPWRVFSSLQDLNVGDPFSYFPAIVKPSAEGSGMGITAESVVHRRDELDARVAWLLREYRQPALAQQFMPGREFTVGILETECGPEPLGILELVERSPNQYFTYNFSVKERADSLIDFVPLREDANLSRSICQLATTAFRATTCRDGARVDIRLSANGEPYFLEINPLPHFHPEIGDYCRSARATGITYSELLRRLIASSLRRWRL